MQPRRLFFYHDRREVVCSHPALEYEHELTGMADVVVYRLLVVAAGATLIALGAFAINDPRTVRMRVLSYFSSSRVAFTDSQVQLAAAAIVLVAVVGIVAAALLPLSVPAAR